MNFLYAYKRQCPGLDAPLDSMGNPPSDDDNMNAAHESIQDNDNYDDGNIDGQSNSSVAVDNDYTQYDEEVITLDCLIEHELGDATLVDKINLDAIATKSLITLSSESTSGASGEIESANGMPSTYKHKRKHSSTVTSGEFNANIPTTFTPSPIAIPKRKRMAKSNDEPLDVILAMLFKQLTEQRNPATHDQIFANYIANSLEQFTGSEKLLLRIELQDVLNNAFKRQLMTATKIGGVEISAVVDSGCKRNLVDKNSWKYLKSKLVQVTNKQKGSNRSS